MKLFELLESVYVLSPHNTLVGWYESGSADDDNELRSIEWNELPSFSEYTYQFRDQDIAESVDLTGVFSVIDEEGDVVQFTALRPHNFLTETLP